MIALKTIIFCCLLLWNLVVFVTYGVDKKRAIRGAWRISERLLLLEALCLGGLGAFVAGKLFHHKIRKWYFQLVWYVGLLVDAAFLYWIW